MYQPTDEDGLPLGHYVQVLWRRKLVVVLVVVVAVGLGALLSSNKKTVFASQAEVLLQRTPAEEIAFPEQLGTATDGGQSRAPLGTEIAIANSRTIREAVEKKVGQPVDVTIAAVGDTQIVTITARNRQRFTATRMAQTYAETYVEVRRKQVIDGFLTAIQTIQDEITKLDAEVAALDAPLQAIDAQLAVTIEVGPRTALLSQREDVLARRQPLLTRRQAFQEQNDQLQLAANLTSSGGAQIISDATFAKRTNIGERRRYLGAALAVGLILGLALAFLLESFSKTVKRKADLEADTGGLPVLGLIPRLRGRRRELVAWASPHSPSAEAYRKLRTAFEQAAPTSSARIVQITSPGAGDGKTVTLANLGLSLARAGHRVVLVDGNLRRPRLHRLPGLDNDVGFTSVMLQGISLDVALRRPESYPGLAVLTAGPPPSDPAETISAHAQPVLTSLARDFEFVLVDGPALLPVTDARMLATCSDAVILVAREHKTNRADLVRAIELLEQVEASVMGTVLNATGTREARSVAYEDRRYAPARLLARWRRVFGRAAPTPLDLPTRVEGDGRGSEPSDRVTWSPPAGSPRSG